MSDRNIPTVDKKDLDNVRQLIENEIKQNKLAPLELTDIISNNNGIDEKYVGNKEDNLNNFIQTTIKHIISNEVEKWLQLKLTEIATPILKKYLINSGSNLTKKDSRKSIINKNTLNQSNIKKESSKNKAKKGTSKKNVNKDLLFRDMSLEDLQKQVKKRGIKLDKRNNKKTLISLLQK